MAVFSRLSSFLIRFLYGCMAFFIDVVLALCCLITISILPKSYSYFSNKACLGSSSIVISLLFSIWLFLMSILSRIFNIGFAVEFKTDSKLLSFISSNVLICSIVLMFNSILFTFLKLSSISFPLFITLRNSLLSAMFISSSLSYIIILFLCFLVLAQLLMLMPPEYRLYFHLS